MSENLELFKFARLYLGQENWNLIKKTSNEELELFKHFSITTDKSYIVFGTPDLLLKFRAFYLTRCLKKRPLYSQYSIHDYAVELSSGVKNEFSINIDQDLIFLYRHQHLHTIGKSEDWLLETILNKVADRNRDGLVTIILSEVRMSYLENSGEFELINLSGLAVKESMSKVLDDIKKEKESGIGSSKTFNSYQD